MKKLGVGIVGPGWVADGHITAYQANPRTEIVALCGRTEESARRKAARHGLSDVRILTDYEAMLAMPETDVVSICTPPHLHAEEVILAAQAGKHMAIEKAVATDLDDMRRMTDAVERAGVKTVVSFVLRWNPLFQIIKRLLESDAIGPVFYGEVDYFHGIGPWYGQYRWNVTKEAGGSSLLSAGCHAIDGLRWFVGKEAVEVSSYSTHGNKTEPFAPYEYDPTSVTIIKFEDGTLGKVASSLECVQPYVFNVNLCGAEGTLRNNQLFSKKLLPGQTNFATIPTVLPDSGDVSHHPFQDEIDHLVRCILDGEESFCNLADAAKTHEIVFAADRSAREGKPVSLPL
jgi:predicted dehydrogenase